MGSEITALVVDDKLVNRKFLVMSLEAAGIESVEAVDGVEAWELLDQDPGRFHVVLLDRMMPRMDGMEVLAKIKEHGTLKDVPVIMQTAADRRQDAIEGIDAGVYHYVTKPYDGKVIATMAQSAITEYQHRKRLRSELDKRKSALALLIDGHFELRTTAEADELAILLASGLPRSNTVLLGLSELLINAVEHGNLAMDYERKSELVEAGAWDAALDERLLDETYGQRKVSVRVTRDAARVSITIEDEGDGFDWRKYTDLDAERAFDAHGRGIALSRKLSFDDVEFRGRGNVVVATVKLES